MILGFCVEPKQYWFNYRVLIKFLEAFIDWVLIITDQKLFL